MSRLPERELLEFTEMLSALLEAGVGLRESLGLLASGTERAAFATVAAELADALDRGESLSSALATRPESFPPIYLGMVAIGERVGSVEAVVPQLARLLRGRTSLRDRTKSALAYPLFVLAIALFGSLAAAFFLVPRLEALFSALGGPAAAAMRSRAASLALCAKAGAVLSLVVAAAFPAMTALRRGSGRAATALDRLLLSLPGIGAALLAYESHNFSFAMEMLARGGVPMELALEEAAAVTGNGAYRAAVLRARQAVLDGSPLSLAFGAQRELPPRLAAWLAIGEGTGRMEQVFGQIARYFRRDMERRGGRYLALLEPALIVLVGGAILLLVLFFVAPLFESFGSAL